ncbi:MAG: beta-galactosidase [Alistipes sp.]|nr:beta-galactosidase [Alistipes sp.]
MKRYILTLLLTIGLAITASARTVYSLNDGWQFFFKLETSSDYARNISLPHTWNLDALSGKGEYLQTIANYTRNIYVPNSWANKRLFVKFYGVQSIADVFVNGHHAGEHRGGWTAFTFEITPYLKYGADNSLVVVVNNAYQNDILPTSSEINLYGGIYRDVELIVTERTAVSPLYYGSDGILIHQNSITDTSVNATASIYITSIEDKSCDMTITVQAPSGETVFSRFMKSRIEPNTPVDIPFTIDEPLLWSPDEPNLYTVNVGIGPRQEDMVSVVTGFRKVEYTGNRLKINGQPIKVQGVSLYHDRAAVGGAMQSRHYDEDIQQVLDIGANAIRSVTAPHSQYLYDRCDQNGTLVWIDTPFTRAPYLSDVFYYSTDKFKQNGLQQMREVIIQNYNHPSVVMWGIYSLVWMRGDKTVLDYVKQLNATAKRLDSSRPTVACSNQDGEINFVSDLIVWQQDLGWERGTYDDLNIWRTSLSRDWSNLRSSIAYGESSSIDQQTDSSMKPATIDERWLPERWHTEFHEEYAQRLAQDSLFWGVWINNLFEFGSVRHNDGISRKGLVTFDRKDKKDAYYLYRALWNKKSPTLHLSEQRRDIRPDSIQKIKFYSSAKEAPVLVVNKDTVKVTQYAPCQYISDPVTMNGRNSVVVKAGELSDQQVITIRNSLRQR